MTKLTAAFCICLANTHVKDCKEIWFCSMH